MWRDLSTGFLPDAACLLQCGRFSRGVATIAAVFLKPLMSQ
jgi:hypothetical protein